MLAKATAFRDVYVALVGECCLCTLYIRVTGRGGQLSMRLQNLQLQS